MLAAGTLKLSFKNQATMLVRPKGRFKRDLESSQVKPAFPTVKPKKHEEEEEEEFTLLSPRGSEASQVVPLTADEAHVPEQPVAAANLLSGRAAIAAGEMTRAPRPNMGSSLAASDEDPAVAKRHSSGQAATLPDAAPAQNNGAAPGSPLTSKPDAAVNPSARIMALSPAGNSATGSNYDSDDEASPVSGAASIAVSGY